MKNRSRSRDRDRQAIINPEQQLLAELNRPGFFDFDYINTSRRARRQNIDDRADLSIRFKNEAKIRRALSMPGGFEAIVEKKKQFVTASNEGVPIIIALDRLIAEAPVINNDPNPKIYAMWSAAVTFGSAVRRRQTAKYDKWIADQYIETTHLAASSMPEPSSPAQCATALDILMSDLSKVMLSSNTEAIMFFSASMLRDSMCIENLKARKEPYDAFGVEEYRADCLLLAQNQTSIKYLQHDVAGLNFNHDLIQKAIQKMEAKLSENIDITQYQEALFDERNPQHVKALRIAKKIFFPDNSIAAIKYLLQAACQLKTGLSVHSQPQLIQALSGSDQELERRFLFCQKFMKDFFGPEAATDFIMYRNYMRDGRVPPSFSKRAPLDQFERIEIEHPEGKEQRIVESVILPEFAEKGEFKMQLDAEKRAGLEKYHDSLIADIKDATVAFEKIEATIDKLGLSFTIIPLEDHFPAVTVGVFKGDYMTVFELDENLLLSKDLKSDSDAREQVIEVLSTYAIAIMHDHLSLRGVREAEIRPTHAGEQPGLSTEPKKRTHRAGRFLVIGDRPESDCEASFSVKEARDGAEDFLTISIEKKPHWHDLAPGLTYQAREQALATVEQAKDQPPWQSLMPEDFARIKQYFLFPDSHSLSTRNLLEKVFAKHKKRAKLPLAEIIDKLSDMVRENYDKIFSAALTNRTIKLPALDLDERMAADRERLRAMGKSYAIPERTKATQTYMPFTQYEERVPAKNHSRIKGYYVVKGASAVEGVSNIIS